MNKWRRFLVACGFSLLALPHVVAAEQTTGFSGAQRPYAFVFPRDHGAHPAYQTEWWYVTGHLQAPDHHRYGFELTIFRVGLRPGVTPHGPHDNPWHSYSLYPAHFALTDIDGRKFSFHERLARETFGEAGAALDHLQVHLDDWTIAMDNTGLMSLHAAEGGEVLDLRMRSFKPPVIHGLAGVSRKGACAACASHYYSFTRLQSVGTLTLGQRSIPVVGAAWLDHEFASSQLDPSEVGWDWFALMLADGREIMLYRLRRRDGSIVPESSGTLVAANGTYRSLGRDDVQITQLATWQSPHTHARYPSGWRVRIPSARLDVVVAPAVADQELDDGTGTPAYWEGASTIRSPEGAALGDAYVELTGYARALSL